MSGVSCPFEYLAEKLDIMSASQAVLFDGNQVDKESGTDTMLYDLLRSWLSFRALCPL